MGPPAAELRGWAARMRFYPVPQSEAIEPVESVKGRFVRAKG